MSVIVAFGDSNTWGHDPVTKGRLAREARWPGVLQRHLGAEHYVIEEGLGGRTTVFDDPIEPNRRGADYLPPCLRSHRPLDLLILSLGCNDMKARFGVSASDIALGMEQLIHIARAEGVPQILIVAPPPIAKLSEYSEMFAGAEEKSRRIGTKYAEVAERQGVGFVDAGQFIHCSDLDGIHYEADQHAILGHVLAEAVRMVLS